MKQKNGMPLAQAAAEDIIEMIRTNHMKPGDRLENEYELAKKLNVGRSTVREAVKSLETRNILTIKRGAGTFISQNEGVAVDPLGISLMGKDEEMALELLDVRMILEPESAALAAIHADKNEITEISRQVFKMKIKGKCLKIKVFWQLPLDFFLTKTKTSDESLVLNCI